MSASVYFWRWGMFPLLVGTLGGSALGQYTIRTIAGGGPDGSPATSVGFGTLSSVAVDTKGNLYFAARLQNQVFKVSPDGVVATIAGFGGSGFFGDGGPATSASLNVPYGVTVDSAGNLFIADTWNSRVRKVTTNGVITTIAGIGGFAFSGDGGLATSAGLNAPASVAVDSAGNLYIADSDNSRVRKVSTSGVISTVAGNGLRGFSGDGGPAASASLYYPGGVAVDGAGNLYIGDTGNRRIRKVSPAGVITTVAGNGETGFSGDGGPATSASLHDPSGVAVDSAGNLYIADSHNSRIRKVSTSGVISTVVGNGDRGFSGDGGPAPGASLDEPFGVALDKAGILYIADTDNGRIRRVLTNGVITTVAGNGSAPYFSGDGGPAASATLNNPFSVATDSTGNVYIADTDNMRVRKVSTIGVITTVAGNGTSGFSGDGGSAISASLEHPSGVAVDAAGNLYIADTNNHRIRKVSTDGAITTVAGNGSSGFSGDGGPATSASLAGPSGLAFDNTGNLYIADTNNHRIRKLSTSGVITTVAGNGSSGFSGDGGPATSASLASPSGLAFDNTGNLYIADTNNHRIRKLSPTGVIATVAGNGSRGFSGDGGPATSASLSLPYGVALDKAGYLYIADTYNVRIRRVSTGGVITTVAGNGSPGFSGDGGPATSASFYLPWSVAVDSYGSLYIADPSTKRIRVLVVSPISVQPSELSFVYQIGTSVPFPQSLTVTSTSNATHVSAVVTDGAAWLSVNPPSASAPATFTVSVNPVGLTDTLYVGNIRLTGVSTSVEVPVYLWVIPYCAYVLTPASFALPAAGTNSSFTVNTNAGCPWTAVSGSPWITVLSGTSGIGTGSVTFQVAANTGSPRSGTIEVTGNQSFSISQSAASSTASGLHFVPITPCRVADTRLATGTFGGPRLNGSETRSFPLPAGACAIPANAAAYSLNVTVVPSGPLSYLTLWAAGQPQPFVSTLNSFDGRIKSNAAIVPAGTGGAVNVFVTDPTHVVLDVNGYFVASDTSGASFYAVPPCRIADTRLAAGPFGGPSFTAGQSRTFPVPASSCGIPASASAYSLNFTAVPSGPLGYLTVWPAGASQPFVSTLNALTGTVTANAAIVPAGTNGAINVFATNNTDLVIDINGYFAAPGGVESLTYFTAVPCRISDTRLTNGVFGGPVMAAGQTRSYPVPLSACSIPSTAKAYSLNATVVPPGPLSYLTLWPSDRAQPHVSTLNSYDGSVTANAAIVPAALNGSIHVFVTNPTHVVLDISGYFQ